jgi:hypothetical protein
MTVMNPSVVLAPGLSELLATPELDTIRQAVTEAGVRPLMPNFSTGENCASEYDFATSISSRAGADRIVKATVPLLERAGGLIVVNDFTEQVQNAQGDRLAGVPYAVGYLASGLIVAANEVYGPDSGRVFLSHRYPDGTELFSLPSNHPVVARTRKRVLDLYPQRPVALKGDMRPAIEKVKIERHN